MIARKSALIIFIQILNGILGYIGLKYIAIYMQPWEYGVIGFAYGFVALFSIFGKLGFDQAHVKRISEGKKLGICIGTFLITKTFLAGLLATFTFLSIFVWKYILNRGFETTFHEQAVYIMLAYFVLLTLTQSITSTFKAKKEIAKAQLPLFGYTIVRITATIFIAYYGLGILALAYTYLLGEIFHFGLALFLFKKYPIEKPSLNYFKDYSKYAIPMAVASASTVIMTNIDKILIQLFWSATQVGEYFAVYNLSHFLILFMISVSTLLLPTISEHHVKKDFKKIKSLVLQSERYLSMIIFPIVFIMIALAYPIIHILLSDKYLLALPVLIILPLHLIFEALSRPYTTKLEGLDMPNLSRNRILLMVIINVILNILLIPKDIQSLGLKLAGLGAEGAAIATVISYTIGLIYIRIMAWKISKIKGNTCIFLHFIAAFISGIIVYYISTILFIGRWYELLLVSFFGFAIYFTILFIFREFKKEDFLFFIDSINIRKMLRYLILEIRHNK